MTSLRNLLVPAAIAALLLSASAFAKLPAPDLTPEAKAKAGEAAAKTAWSAKVDNFKLCQAQDRVAAAYRASATSAGKPVTPPTATPPCADPGTFAYTGAPADAKPIEASGAHSPATTAASPPSTNAKASEVVPTPKK